MEELVERLEIRTPSLEQPVQFLSGGNQQKVAVSRTFLREPAVILAYEPTQGVDVGSRFDIYAALRSRTDAGTALLVKSSDPLELAGSVRPGARDVPGPDRRGDPRRRARRASHRRSDRPRARACPRPDARRWAWRCRRARPRGARRERARLDSARLALRKVLRDARDKNKWRKIVRFRLWMPVVLQLLLIVAVASYTNARFPGFINRANVTSILILAVPLAMVAMGQTHALLVGYLDLSVGAMVTLGVVVASFLIGPESTTTQILLGVAAIFLLRAGPRTRSTPA